MNSSNLLTSVTSFTRYELTEKDFLSGCIFNILQLQVIQNLICDSAERKVALKYDPLNPMAFLQEEAQIQGEIQTLRYLLELHNAAMFQHNNTIPNT